VRQGLPHLPKDILRGYSFQADTPFLLASVSKPITAVGIMQLVEAGKLRLNAPVTEYLPWFKVGGSGGAITVANLLYQTSGLPEIEGQNVHLRRDAPDALEAGVRDLARVSQHFKPGSSWEYELSSARRLPEHP
jgi:CubicO group peptidase (beta-lactamase class C family)